MRDRTPDRSAATPRPSAPSRLALRIYMAWFTPGFRLGRAHGG